MDKHVPPPMAAVIPPSQRASRLRNVVVLVLAGGAAYMLLRRPLDVSQFRAASPLHTTANPADEFKDDVWPFRQPTPWDISTDFPHPRKLEYQVTESTWSNIDVHPTSGEIVFDMIGDLYCLAPNSKTAHPILRGVPHDTEPQFSPSGDLLAFRSDAELGLDNIWALKWTGCESMSLHPARLTEELAWAILYEDDDEALLAKGVRETSERKARRMIREGRTTAYRVTNETFRFVTHPRWHPSGSTIIAQKSYTGASAIGAAEVWQFPVPPADGQMHHVDVGAGKRVIGRTLPLGWPASSYNKQNIGPEQAIWSDEDTIIYSKNAVDTDGVFQYNKDIHQGIYAIFRHNVSSGSTETLVSSFPGGANRPELSRDGKTLAFVRRVRDKEALVFVDLASGTLTHVWYGLTYDLSTIYAPMGTYPTFSFTPNDDAVIIWAAGKIWRIPLTVNNLGQKVGKGTPVQLPFIAKVAKRIAKTLRPKTNLINIETAEHQRLYAFSEPDVNEHGDTVLVNGAGVTYYQSHLGVVTKPPIVAPRQHPELPYYSPSFVPLRPDLIVHARWHDTNFTTFELAQLTSGFTAELIGLPLGRYTSPTISGNRGPARKIAFVRFGGTTVTGNVVATAGEGLYVGDITIPGDFSWTRSIEIHNVRLVSPDITNGPLKLRFLEGARKLLVQRDDNVATIDLTSEDPFGAYAQTQLASAKKSNEVAVSSTHLAWVEQQHVYLVPLKEAGSTSVWAKPGNATRGTARLSLDGGHDVVFSGDGKKLFWLLGPYLHSLEVSRLDECGKAIRADETTFGIDCVKKLLQIHELHVTYPSAVAPRESDGVFVVKNATLVTMASGDEAEDVIRRGTIVVSGGTIQQVGKDGEVDIPNGATVLDAEGGIVTPGFIDVHAHWEGHFTGSFPLPARDWQHVAFLAYGVTTLHNPSFDNQYGYIERALVESGRMIAPRILHTGRAIYGADLPGYHHEIVDMDQAREALTRVKVEGGPASFSYKNYMLPSRAARQRLLTMAKNMSMLAVPEGGMNFHWDVTYITDGMATVEHNIPIPVLYDDVLTLYVESGTGTTPTHIVNYGGPMGEALLWQSRDLAFDEKLRRFLPHEMLEALQESQLRPKHSYALFNVSESTAAFVRRGGLANLGAHGQSPIGLMYHHEASLFAAGGLTPYEVLRAATRDGARSIGIFDSVGSLSVGKFADFVVYKPRAKVLDDISDSPEIKYVARSGRVWEAEEMAEYWPQKHELAPMPPLSAD